MRRQVGNDGVCLPVYIGSKGGYCHLGPYCFEPPYASNQSLVEGAVQCAPRASVRAGMDCIHAWECASDLRGVADEHRCRVDDGRSSKLCLAARRKRCGHHVAGQLRERQRLARIRIVDGLAGGAPHEAVCRQENHASARCLFERFSRSVLIRDASAGWWEPFRDKKRFVTFNAHSIL